MSLAFMHSIIVGDERRARAFRDALHVVVRRGDVVVDVGAGTGLLGLFACQAGARRVYAIEKEASLLPIARAIAHANGFADRLTLVHGRARDVTLPEPADVLVSEMVGLLGVDEDIVEILTDAARFLRPEGTIVPARLDVLAAAVDAGEARKLGRPWAGDFFGIDLRPARHWAASEPHSVPIEPDELLSDAGRAFSVTFTARPAGPPRSLHGTFDLCVTRPGTLNALAGWFALDLAPGVPYSTAPGEGDSHWQQALLPIAEPLPVQRGDVVRVTLAAMVDASLTVWSWRGDAQRGGHRVGGFDQSTLEALPLEPKAR